MWKVWWQVKLQKKVWYFFVLPENLVRIFIMTKLTIFYFELMRYLHPALSLSVFFISSVISYALKVFWLCLHFIHSSDSYYNMTDKEHFVRCVYYLRNSLKFSYSYPLFLKMFSSSKNNFEWQIDVSKIIIFHHKINQCEYTGPMIIITNERTPYTLQSKRYGQNYNGLGMKVDQPCA